MKKLLFLFLLFPVYSFAQHDTHDTPIALLEHQMKEVNETTKDLVKINNEIIRRLITLETSVEHVKNQMQDIKESKKDGAFPTLKEIIILSLIGAGAGSGGLHLLGKRNSKEE